MNSKDYAVGYIGVSELGVNSEFVKLFGGMIGFFIGLWMTYIRSRESSM